MVYKMGTKVVVSDGGICKLGIILRKNYHSNLQGYRFKVMLENEIIHMKVPLLSRDYIDRPKFYIHKELSEQIPTKVSSRISILSGNINNNKWNNNYQQVNV